MDFLNKLYESNYFGIGLFAVISFLVVTFLIVLFFGKKDEQKRKENNNNSLNTFKETNQAIKLETPVEVSSEVTEPVMPVPPIAPVAPINYEAPVAPKVEKVAPINVEPVTEIINEPASVVEAPVVPDVTPVAPIINETVTPIITESVVPVMPNISEPVIVEPVKFEMPASVEPKVMEPIKITIPEEPVAAPTPVIEPIIKEEAKPIITEPTVVEAPVINDSYYKPVEKVESENVSVPNIDFDAIAKSISQELDELERNTNKNKYEEIKVTPMSEINRSSSNQFSSVYVNTPVRKEPTEPVGLPKRIDLPTKKDNEIEPENYNL